MAILDGKLDVTTQEGYDIACALRGPDLAKKLTYLKAVLVGRLRALMGVPAGVFTVVVDSPFLTDVMAAMREWKYFSEWLKEIDQETRRHIHGAVNHWACHLTAAYKTLLGIEDTEELGLLLAITYALQIESGVVEALEAYAEYIKEQP